MNATRHILLWAAVAILLLLLAVMGPNTPIASASDGEEVHLEGQVHTSPASSDGTGLYRIRDADGDLHLLVADEQTEFHVDRIPVDGETVRARGTLQSTDGLIAERITVIDDTSESGAPDSDSGPGDDGGGDGDDDPCLDTARSEWEGLVLTRPAAAEGAIGTWTLQLENAVVLTVVVDAATRLDRGIPGVGVWVKLRGELTDVTTCTVLARRMRPDDIENGQVVVRLSGNAQPDDLVNHPGYDLVFLQTLVRSGNIHLFMIDEDDSDEEAVVRRLNNDARVMWAELNYVSGVPESDGYKTWGWGSVDESGYQNQGAFDQVNLAPALAELSGAGVVVAVLDTGIEQNHPAFAGRLLAGRDLVDDDADPQEVAGGLAWGHGTHISGIVRALAPDASLLPVRVLDGNGRGNMFTLAYAIEWSVDNGADVINLSLGAEVDSRVLEETVATAVADGVLIVAAAGNGDTDVVQYPAGFAGVVSVTAVDDAGVKAAFANYGASWVDVAAPGTGVISTVPDYDADGVADYSAWSGTSMAAPFVSGAAALVREVQPAVTAAELMGLLEGSVVNLDESNGGIPAGALGGLLDVAAVTGIETNPAPEQPEDPTTPTDPEQPTDPEMPGGEINAVYLPLVINR